MSQSVKITWPFCPHRRLPNSSCFHFCPPQTDTPVHPLFYSLSLSVLERPCRMATTVAEQQQITDRIIISSTFYTFVRKKKIENIFISL